MLTNNSMSECSLIFRSSSSLSQVYCPTAEHMMIRSIMAWHSQRFHAS